jgi:hypothetical protein
MRAGGEEKTQSPGRRDKIFKLAWPRTVQIPTASAAKFDHLWGPWKLCIVGRE